MNDRPVFVDAVDREVLQWLQDAFPVTGRPFARGAEELGIPEEELLTRAIRLWDQGIIRNLRTIVHARGADASSSTLVAMRVPEQALIETARIINGYPGVTHNYRREHDFNLWFTLTAKSIEERRRMLEEIQKRTGIGDPDTLDLPTSRVFKVDVRFRFTNNGVHKDRSREEQGSGSGSLDAIDRVILNSTQHRIPLTREPFNVIAQQLGIDQDVVLQRLERQKRSGVIKRIGITVNQRELGIAANAVVAWNVPQEDVDHIGEILASHPQVTHCYEREIVPGRWEYNLFAVLHGHTRMAVKSCARRLAETTGLRDYLVLFSTEQFKRTSVIHLLPYETALPGSVAMARVAEERSEI